MIYFYGYILDRYIPLPLHNHTIVSSADVLESGNDNSASIRRRHVSA